VICGKLEKKVILLTKTDTELMAIVEFLEICWWSDGRV
jgi:hypothetical protein